MTLLFLAANPIVAAAIAAAAALCFVYLVRLNQLLSGTPAEIRALSPSPWTTELLLKTYRRLEANPITTKSYAHRIPPKLARRYIVTGGSGLVGGYIVLQLLERGQPPESIRIVDLRRPDRDDMAHGPATDVDFVQTDISAPESVGNAFEKPWKQDLGHLPLTVFHTAAVIVPSDRSKLEYGFCEAINIRGTQNVVEAAKRFGADVFISTTSASISIRPVQFWLSPWKLWSGWLPNFWQILDEKDFWLPLRKHEDFYANYPASKAAAERIVCEANTAAMRSGTIRPANGVYGNPTDNTVGGPLQSAVFPTWTPHIVQSFAHGINTAIAHLQFEAVLALPESHQKSQAGRPFIITDPNPPIAYRDLYLLVEMLSVTPFRTIILPPVVILLLAHMIEAYTLLRLRFPVLQWILPPMQGDIKHLKPAIFSICTHLVAHNDVASRPVSRGGLGYTGVLTTLEGMTQEVIEWNHLHQNPTKTKRFQSSVSLAEDIQRATSARSHHGESKHAMMK
ncbi:hypothetical protein QBC47DRAFT_133782 [Echria macrotheca]|uniref:3-beta hydroxysteroid dehydrogenase/isomerase domain-containing protein n=1 Tax=Echria macrotheca TaxID=438768 RepID=A0AAJ0FCB3_9PEZI|nr:hypothetical protein QBC47DRAFT_133782 [Echria macrotheca]